MVAGDFRGHVFLPCEGWGGGDCSHMTSENHPRLSVPLGAINYQLATKGLRHSSDNCFNYNSAQLRKFG